jgi:uncharacterized membrane protein YeaQ/YmgE (transglycosylase-associated protein family)
MSADSWYAWFAIGAAASLGGMIWAFRRGVLGVLANFAAGIGGALLGGALAHGAYGEYPAPSHPTSLFFAGLGAIVALVVLHLAWRGLLVWRGRQAPAH